MVKNHKPQKERSDISLGDVMQTGKTRKINLRKMINPQKSLRARLCLCFCVTSLTFGICLLVTTIFSTNQLLLRENGKTLTAISQSTAERMTSNMYAILSHIKGFVKYPIFQTIPASNFTIVYNNTNLSFPSWIRRIMCSSQQSLSYMVEISYILQNGTIYVSTNQDKEGSYVGNEDWFQSTLGKTHEIVIGSPETSTKYNTTVVHFSLGVLNITDNSPLGAIIMYIDWEYAKFLDFVSVYQDLDLYIFDSNRKMYLAPNTTTYTVGEQVPLYWLDDFVKSSSQSGSFQIEEFVNEKNVSQLVGDKLVVGMAKCPPLSHVNMSDWIVVMTLPAHEAMSLTIALRNKLILFSIIFWFILSGIGWCIASQIVHPLTRTSQIADMLMRDNEKFNKSISQEFEIPEASYKSLEGDQQLQDSILGILKDKHVAQNTYLKDEVYTLCRSTELLMHILYHQRMLTLKLEQVVAERTKVLRDEVTRRKEMQKAAEEAKRNAEAAEAAKSRFLANMSHEIRTPMNGILGTLLLLLDTKLLGEQIDYVMTMKHCADSLLCIINDILMYSKLEADKLQLDNSVFQIEDVCEGVGKLLGPLAAAKSVDMYFLIDPQVPALCVGDPGRLRQVLINLVGNSVKFTDIGGEIVVVCSIGCTTCYLRKVFGSSDNYQHGGGDHECFDQFKIQDQFDAPKSTHSSISSSSKSTSSSSAMTSNSDSMVGVRIDKAEKADDRRSSTRLLLTQKSERDREREEKDKRRSASAKVINEMEYYKKKKGKTSSVDSSKTHSRSASTDGTEMKTITEEGKGNQSSISPVNTANKEGLHMKHSRTHSGNDAAPFEVSSSKPLENEDFGKFRRHSTTSVGKFGKGFKIIIPNNNNAPTEDENTLQKNKRSTSLDGYAHMNNNCSSSSTHESIECFKPGAVCSCKTAKQNEDNNNNNNNNDNNNNNNTTTKEVSNSSEGTNTAVDTLTTNTATPSDEKELDQKLNAVDEQLIRFEVRDNGCGISKEQIGRLFTPFFQADNSTTRVKGGTGLGLSICKQLVELFGGTTFVQSTLNKGSSFSFSARFSAPPQPSPRPPPTPSSGPTSSSPPSPFPPATIIEEDNNVLNSSVIQNDYESPLSSPASTILIPTDECLSSGPASPVSLSLSLCFTNTDDAMPTPLTPFPYALSSPPPAQLPPVTPSHSSPPTPLSAMFSLTSSLPNIDRLENAPTTPRSVILPTGNRPPLPLPSPRSNALSSSFSSTTPRITTSPQSQRPHSLPSPSHSVSALSALTSALAQSFNPPPLNLISISHPASPLLLMHGSETPNNNNTPRTTPKNNNNYNNIVSPKISNTPLRMTPKSTPRSRLVVGGPFINVIPQIDISVPIRVLVASDKQTFLRVAAQAMSSLVIANIVPVTTSEMGKALAKNIGSGDYSIGIIYYQNPEHLMINAKLILTYLRQTNKKPIPIIVVCSMAANSSVRKKLHSLGVTTIFTPMMCAKLNDTVLSVLAQHNIIKDENNQYKNSLPVAPTTPLTIPYVPALIVAHPSSPAATTQPTTVTTPTTAEPASSSAEQVHPLQRISSSTAEKKNAMRVLAVEDNPINMKILKKYLERMEIVVTFASDGLEAVEAVRSKPVNFFDLVFMDLHMPHMDGMQATAEIRKWEEEQYTLMGERYEKGVTIVALTADVLTGTEQACSSAGMDGYISKPIDYKQLLAKVEEVKYKKI